MAASSSPVVPEAPPSFSPTARVLRPRRAAPSDAVRPTRAEINLAHLRHNLRVVQRAAGSASVYAVLKADGYGHGAPAVARVLERAGTKGFAVALLEEAVELREAGIRAPILVMGGYYGNAWDEILDRELTPVIYEPGQVEALARYLRLRNQTSASVHMKIDTGMSRLGVRADGLTAMFDAFRRHPEVSLDGLMTHLACADLPSHEANAIQLARFDELSATVRENGFSPSVRHAANSAALLAGFSSGMDIARPGIALFGVPPMDGVDPAFELRPVMRVRSEVVAIRELAKGESAGYGWTWTAPRTTRLATVPVGYADGLPREHSNLGHLLIRGHRAPICGAVSMDLVMVDVTDIPGVELRDEAVILGTQQFGDRTETLPTTEIASLCGTIPWEILTNISRRVPRFYREP